jgi:5-methylcytosine-specific restriction endonuclease McrA
MSELPKIVNSEAALAEAEAKFAQTQQAKEKLKQQRRDGKLLYSNWQGSDDWQQWRMQQLEKQNWKCACCTRQMSFGEKTYQANGDFTLEPQHPTVDHILPKSFFPELALNRQNLVMVCWSCNKKKGRSIVLASRMRHKMLKQHMNL